MNRQRFEKGFQRVMQPANSDYIKYEVSPKSTSLSLTDPPIATPSAVNSITPEPVEASGILIWAKSESGDKWEQNRYTFLPIVEPNVSLGGDRAYHAQEIATYVFNIDPSPGPRAFADRVIRVRNDTPELLTVRVRFLSDDGKSTQWSQSEFHVDPGNAGSVPGNDGWARSSQAIISAQSANLRFAEKRFWTVAEVSGRRAYSADRIGTFEFAFKSPVGSALQPHDSSDGGIRPPDDSSPAGGVRPPDEP